MLPAPLDDWYSIPYRLFGPWWQTLAPASLSQAEQGALFQLLAALLLALALPLLALRRQGLSLADVGLARSHSHGRSVTIIGLLLSVPLGFWLTLNTPSPWGSPLHEALGLLFIVPEHFLVFGVFGALLLPGGRAQWGTAGWFAVLAATVNFGLLHVGTPNALELWSSFPLGLLFAIMTFACGSIWPAVIAHASLNVVPILLLPLVT